MLSDEQIKKNLEFIQEWLVNKPTIEEFDAPMGIWKETEIPWYPLQTFYRFIVPTFKVGDVVIRDKREYLITAFNGEAYKIGHCWLTAAQLAKDGCRVKETQ